MKKLLRRFKISIFPWLLLLGTYTEVFATKYNLDWVNSIGASGRDDIADICIGKDGYIYSVGYVELASSSSIDFDPSNRQMILSGTQPCYFISKTDRLGNPIWVKKVIGSGTRGVGGSTLNAAITSDTFNNLYITGQFTGTVDFDPGPGVFNQTSQNVMGGGDFFITKLDSSGGFIWSKQIIGTASESFAADMTYANGALYLLYNTLLCDDSLDADPGSAVHKLPYTPSFPGEGNSYLIKLDENGDYVWAKYFLSDIDCQGLSLKLDRQQNIIVGGQYIGTANFDPGKTNYSLTTTKQQAYFLKLNKDGNFLWAKSLEGGRHARVYFNCAFDVEVDENGNVYATGKFRDTTDFDPGINKQNLISRGEEDIFILKLNKNGDFVWVKQLGGIANDMGLAISVTDDGKIYASNTLGLTNNPMDIDPNTGIFNVVTPLMGSMHHGIVILDTAGSFIWGGIVAPVSNDLNAYSMATIRHDAEGNIYLGSYYRGINMIAPGTLDFDPGPDSLGVNYAGVYDMFLTRLSRCIQSEDTQVVQACNSYIFRGHTYTQSGIYTTDTVYLTAGLCDSSFILDLTIANIPDTSIAYSSHKLTSLATNCNYQWVDCDNGYTPVRGATNSDFTPANDGNYAVIVTGSLGCADTSYCYYVTSNLGVQELGTTNIVRIYPNPVQNLLTIQAKKSLQNGSVRIMSAAGQIMSQQTNLIGNRFQLDISSIAPGIYIVEIQEESQIVKAKLIKQ